MIFRRIVAALVAILICNYYTVYLFVVELKISAKLRKYKLYEKQKHTSLATSQVHQGFENAWGSFKISIRMHC